MANKPIVANQKLWLDKEGNIVPDGDESANTLLAVPGQTINPKSLIGVKNVEDYFDEDGDPVEHREPPKGRRRGSKSTEDED